jgi:methyl-accepting chemotaxis protein
MTITRRLAITLLVALVALIFVSAYGFWAVERANERLFYVRVNTIPAILDTREVISKLADVRATTLARAMTGDPVQQRVRDERINASYIRLDAVLQRDGTDRTLDKGEQELLDVVKASVAAYRVAQEKFVEQTSRLNGGDVTPALVTLNKATVGVMKALDDQANYERTLAQNVGAASEAAARSAFWMLGAITTLALCIVVALGIELFRVVRSGLRGIQEAIEGVSSTLELDRRAPVSRKDEIGNASIAFNRLMDRIVEVVGTARRSSDAVSAAARQIAAGSMELSSRTEQQAASLEETAATMEQLTSAVRQNRDHAREASKVAEDASNVATEGQKVVAMVVRTINEIDESSAKISEIIGIIDGIAFQTNILALNAAVEAARAGQQGRGFAVVAAEVRSLAQRCSTAAKDIKDLIVESVKKVQKGSSLAGGAVQTMTDITNAAASVAAIMGDIASASDEQSRGIEQLNQAISQMDQVTQQTAALVEESAAAAKSLEDQGTQLSSAVSVFRFQPREWVGQLSEEVCQGQLGRLRLLPSYDLQ